MNLDTLFDNFEMLADAPSGVPKLREMILQMAVQGKLVPQDSSDEPASVLLEKIKTEKDRLIKEKRIKRAKQLIPITSDEIPYELPEGWQWSRLGIIANAVHYGYTASADDTKKDVRLLRITDIQNDRVNWDTVPGCVIDQNKIAYYELNDGDLLIARTGGTIGKTYLVNDIPVCSVFASYLIRVVPTYPLLPEFLKLFSGSLHYWQQLYAKCSGTGQPNVNATSLKKLTIAVPPLPEQKRIVTKVDQLMAICDELEARKQKRKETRIALNDAALDRLLSARKQKDFTKHWNRISNNFNLLYDTPETVDKLRQTILQLAVQGKLVPQDPRDPPASVLFEKIKAEKERLIKEKKIRKAKSLLPIAPDEIPYELPDGWEWVRLGVITSLKSGSTINKDLELSNENEGIPYIKVGDMNLPRNEKTISISNRYVKVTKNLRKNIIPSKSIIFPKRGGAIATNKKRFVKDEIFADSNVMAIISIPPIYIDYVFSWFMHIDLWELNSGTSVPQINNKDIDPLLFSLPPLNEQKRIVTKINELMAHCDELATKLSQSQTDCDELLNAIVNNIENESLKKIPNNRNPKANTEKIEPNKTALIEKHINTSEKMGASISKPPTKTEKQEKKFDKL